MKRNADLAELRKEFWSASEDSLLDRDTTGAALYLGRDAMESLAIKGGGPRYLRLARRALYRKSDVLAWIEKTGRRVENTAQLIEATA